MESVLTFAGGETEERCYFKAASDIIMQPLTNQGIETLVQQLREIPDGAVSAMFDSLAEQSETTLLTKPHSRIAKRFTESNITRSGAVHKTPTSVATSSAGFVISRSRSFRAATKSMTSMPTSKISKRGRLASSAAKKKEHGFRCALFL